MLEESGWKGFRVLLFNPKTFIIIEFTLLLLIALLLRLLIHSIIIPCLFIHNTINLDSIYNQIPFMWIRYSSYLLYYLSENPLTSTWNNKKRGTSEAIKEQF